ncbi:hypothetical protein WN55_08001 [Dufourea novaeangliae]|uniref:Uncharacterized protein n=1 Tax=Dufourea novaeangliae TaxID=178035 RepID=A0A154P763_DUFNO|nr:hypothetical protein WN55_08001 [Dufourea novaeangliae]
MDSRGPNQPLASLRLYFLPENTPDGRRDSHGEMTRYKYLQGLSDYATKLFEIDSRRSIESSGWPLRANRIEHSARFDRGKKHIVEAELILSHNNAITAATIPLRGGKDGVNSSTWEGKKERDIGKGDGETETKYGLEFHVPT